MLLILNELKLHIIHIIVIIELMTMEKSQIFIGIASILIFSCFFIKQSCIKTFLIEALKLEEKLRFLHLN